MRILEYLNYDLCQLLESLTYTLDSILVATAAIFLYSTYVFLPGHAVMMMHFFEYLLGSDASVPQEKVS